VPATKTLELSTVCRIGQSCRPSFLYSCGIRFADLGRIVFRFAYRVERLVVMAISPVVAKDNLNSLLAQASVEQDSKKLRKLLDEILIALSERRSSFRREAREEYRIRMATIEG
jgi:hypothetical protein